MTRRAYEPDEKSRKQIAVMAGIGLTHDQIAKIMGVSDETLRKYYRDELDTGEARMNAAVAQNLYSIATSKGQGAVAAAIFWMKTRANWREVNRTEVSGPEGSAIKTESVMSIDTTKMDATQREALKAALLSIAESESK